MSPYVRMFLIECAALAAGLGLWLWWRWRNERGARRRRGGQ